MIIKSFIIIAYCLFIAVSTLCRPDFLSGNKFLDDFAGHDLLSLLAVILTITFASVANIHLALNQIILKVFSGDIRRGQDTAQATRDDIDSNAWLLFWAFIACTAFLLVKGAFGEANIYVKSAMNGLCLGALLVNILVFHDIYRTVFTLASSHLAVAGAKVPEFSPDTPKAAPDED